MKGLPFLFLAFAISAALFGMGWGIQMSIIHDHAMAPAHAHLNLIGFVLMAIYGIY